MKLSNVIPARTEAGNIAGLIEGIDRGLARLARFEIIVVDDGSSDDSVARQDTWSKKLASRFANALCCWQLKDGSHKLEPMIILGQLPDVVIYSRNLWPIRAEQKR